MEGTPLGLGKQSPTNEAQGLLKPLFAELNAVAEHQRDALQAVTDCRSALARLDRAAAVKGAAQRDEQTDARDKRLEQIYRVLEQAPAYAEKARYLLMRIEELRNRAASVEGDSEALVAQIRTAKSRADMEQKMERQLDESLRVNNFVPAVTVSSSSGPRKSSAARGEERQDSTTTVTMSGATSLATTRVVGDSKKKDSRKKRPKAKLARLDG